MEKLYIGLVDTPGLFAWMIRKAIRQDYIHVVLGMDEMLDECYSVEEDFLRYRFWRVSSGKKGENHTGISNGALHDICHRLHKRAEGKYQKAVEKML